MRPIPQGLQIVANDQIKGSFGLAIEGKTSNYYSHIRIYSDDGLSIEVIFPDCMAVDSMGEPILTSPGGTNHVAYSSGRCPFTHPYNIPQLTQIINWKSVRFDSNWYLSSDPSSAMKGSTTHADYIAGWTEKAAQIMIDCVRDLHRECGPPLQKHWKDQFLSASREQIYDFSNLLTVLIQLLSRIGQKTSVLTVLIRGNINSSLKFSLINGI